MHTYWTKTWGTPWLEQTRREIWAFGPRVRVIRYDDTALVWPGERVRRCWVLTLDGLWACENGYEKLADAMREGERIG